MKVITPGIVETHLIRHLSFGSIPKKVLIEIVSDNRILGQIMESEIANSFHGFTKQGVNAKSQTEDLFYGADKKVQCKAINFQKSISIVKSSLWDTRDGVRRSWREWDTIHNAFFDEQDYLMIFNTTNFQTDQSVEILFVTPEMLRDVAADETRMQVAREAKRRQKRYYSAASVRTADNSVALVPDWRYPVEISETLWHNLKR